MALALAAPFRVRPVRFAGFAAWRRLHQPSRHPIADHFRKQIRRSRRLPAAPWIAVIGGIALLLALAWAYTGIGGAVVWTLPLWLMLHSLICGAVWMRQIVVLIGRQARDGVMDEIGVIPPGAVFIYLTICKVILHQNDGLAWLTALRKTLAGIFCIGMLFPLLVTLRLLDRVDATELALMLIELALFAALVYFEHRQSVALACALPMALCRRLPRNLEATIGVIIGYIVFQLLSYGAALGLPVLLTQANPNGGVAEYALTLFLLLFLLLRELMLMLLWRVVLLDANDDIDVFLPSQGIADAT